VPLAFEHDADPPVAGPSWGRRRSARRHGAAKSDNPASRRAPHRIAGLASSGFSRQVLQDRIVQHALRQQPLGVGHLQPTLLRLQLLECRRAEPVLAANLRSRQASLLLLDHPDDLLLGKTALPHSSPLLGQTLHQIEGASGGRSTHSRHSALFFNKSGWCSGLE